MARLARTAGLTDVQEEILSTVRTFVDKEIIPHAQALEHGDTYPADIVEGTRARYVEAYEKITGEPFAAWLERTAA